MDSIIYLDQFAISGMADGLQRNNGNQWQLINNSLIELKQRNIVKCYTSIETILETSQRDEAHASNNSKLITKLTDNIYIKELNDIICMQINSLIKNTQYSFNDFTTYCNYDFTTQHNNTNSYYADVKKIYNNKNAIRYNNINKDIMLLLQEMPKQSCYQLILEYFINNPSDIYIQLLTQYCFSKQDLNKLLIELRINGFKNIPALHIKTLLDIVIIKNNHIEIVNDIIDIRRIAMSLPLCDIVLCDKRWKKVIIDQKLDEKYGVKVFSGTPDDLNSLITK